MQTSAHLHFKGNCREALRFYEEVLGGRIVLPPEAVAGSGRRSAA